MEEKQTFYSVSSDIVDFGKIQKIQSYKTTRQNRFSTEVEAKKDFERCYKIAKERLKIIQKELNKLKEVNQFDISYFFFGDTHGIYDSGMYISIDIEYYTFNLRIND